MKNTWAMIAVSLALVLVGIGVFSVSAQTDPDTAPPVMPQMVDIAQGAVLYTENCAACHGAQLEGQPDWRSPGADGILPPPPHDVSGHTWHHADRALFEYTQLGGREALAQQGLDFESGMPAFGGPLSDAEIWNILAFIQSTWPDRNQEIQAARTEADLARGDY